MQTVAFYSYKGGLGRTLLVANFAYFLAKCQKRVFVLDMDLEAPGLHYRFPVAKAQPSHPGFVDYALHIFDHGTAPSTLGTHVYSMDADLCVTDPATAAIHFMPAGAAPSTQYIEALFRVLRAQFHRDNQRYVADVVQTLRDQISREYSATDYLLIDSRTGITETSRIALEEATDTAVCLFGQNDESRDGAAGVIRGLLSAKTVKRVVPLLSRVGMQSHGADQHLIAAALDRLQRGGPTLIQADGTPVTVTILHEDVVVPRQDERLWRDGATLLESVLLYDYLNLFAALAPDVFAQSKYRAIAQIYPQRAALDEWQLWNVVRDVGPAAMWNPSQVKLRVVDRKDTSDRGRSFLNFVPSLFVPGGSAFHDFGRSVGRSLAGRLDPTCDIEEKDEEEVNFELLASEMKEGIIDFCGEGYFLTAARMPSAGVVQFGRLRSFTCLVRADGALYNELAMIQDDSIARVLASLFRSSIAAQINIGLLPESAATDEAAPHVTRYISGKRIILQDHMSLAHWINESATNILLCDHGVRQRVLAEMDAETRGQYDPIGREFRFEHETPEYGDAVATKPIAVGFLYPKSDLQWRREISSAVASVVRSIGEPGWNRVAADLRSVKIDPFSYGELRAYLSVDMTLSEAETWRDGPRWPREKEGA